MLAVIKKEFKTYFLTPIGYVFLAVFIGLFSLIYYALLFNSDAYYVGKFEYVIYYCVSLVFMFIVPLLTMKMFADEKAKGTDALIFTSPRSILGIVLGKFIAATFVIMICALLMIPYYILLRHFASPTLNVSLVALLGFIIVGMAYISFGMFASSLSSNQLIAAIVSIGFFIFTSFFDSTSGVFATISLMDMYQKFPIGIISLQEVLGYASFIILFLLLTIIVLQRRKSLK